MQKWCKNGKNKEQLIAKVHNSENIKLAKNENLLKSEW